MSKKLLAICLLFAAAAQASVTFEPTYSSLSGTLQNSAGGDMSDGTYVMLLDLDNDGLDGQAYDAQPSGLDSSSSWLWDSDDLLMDRGQIGGVFPDGWAVPSYSYSWGTEADYDAGVDEYYVLWFDMPYDESATFPGEGVDYGVELLGVAGNNGDTLTPNGLGGTANLTTTTVIPEPSSLLLGLLAMAAVVRRRRINR